MCIRITRVTVIIVAFRILVELIEGLFTPIAILATTAAITFTFTITNYFFNLFIRFFAAFI